ncbi:MULTISPECIES: MurR/RpiR family transcriptional regulator [Thioclava]|uniref:MurR/RpiR family transcriptional regulator n=1 Tax=Thioclava kandeliae TaxID=3070818 RepID=A0ABV1SHN3_9RHOB
MPIGFSSFSDAPLDELARKIEAGMADLPKQEAKVAQYILLNLASIPLETGQSIASKAGVAEITVGRMLRRFDCAGMKEFKALLRQRYSVSGEVMGRKKTELSRDWQEQLTVEMHGVQMVYDQMETPAFTQARDLLAGSGEVYVTGFQTIRGLAEDCARRLALARDNVRFLSGHDSMLSEWIAPVPEAGSCLMMFDVIPYAAEAEMIARIAKDRGAGVVLITDEYCHWAQGLADAVINAPSKTGLFLESTLGLHAAASLLVHATAEAGGADVAGRMQAWKRMSHRLKLF